MPTINVVIPTYRRKRLLKSCLLSVQAQTFQDYEVLIIDDGSEDNLSDLAGQFVPPKWKFLRLKRRLGPAAARNMGIRASNSPLIAFLDSDDLWDPKKLEAQAVDFSDPKVIFSYSDFNAVDSKGDILYKNCLRSESPYKKSFRVMRRHGFYRLWPNTSTVVLRRNILDEVGLFNEEFRRRHEDTDLWLRIHQEFSKGWKFHRDALASTRIHPEQVTSSAQRVGTHAIPERITRETAEILLDNLSFGRKYEGNHACA